MIKATALANSNIAFVKYWGKSDEELNLPMNSNISMTLDGISTKTTVEFSENYDNDEFILNNVEQSGDKLKRVSNFLDIVRKKAKSKLFAKVVSKNNFPTGAGIASSASGFAALASASSKALGLELSKNELSSLARLGSGSACRSINGGFNEWHNEYAVQIKDEKHWTELRDIIVLIDKNEKAIGSRQAMKLSLDTESYRNRIKEIDKALIVVRNAIKNKYFSILAKATMQDSDNMHDCIKKTQINYLTRESESIKKIINNLNKSEIIAAYSFDAGPNAHIITLEKYVDKIIKLLNFEYLVAGPGSGVKFRSEHLF